MNLRGCDQLKLWMMGVAAAGLLGPGRVSFAADGKRPFLPSAKKPAEKLSPAVAAEPPRLLPVPDGQSLDISSVQQVQAIAENDPSQKSEVMRQLELLYQQDGREMPDLQVIQPVPTDGSSSTGAAATKAPAQRTQTAPSQTQTANQPYGHQAQQRLTQPTPSSRQVTPTPPAAEPAPSKNPVTAFFRKLVPGKKESAVAPTPPDYRPDVAPTPPGLLPRQEYAPAVSNRPAQPSGPFAAPPQAGYSMKPIGQPAIPSAGAAPATGSPAATTNNPGLPALSKQPVGAAAPRFDVPPAPTAVVTSPPAATQSSALLPPLLSQPQLATTAEAALSSNDEPTAPKGDGLDNLFTEMSEEAADSELKSDPFTGLTLDEDSPKLETPATETVAQPKLDVPAQTATNEDPFADELRKLGILPSVEEEAPKIAAKPTEPSSLDGIEDEATREKMKKIRDRDGMKGLKGFCPVTLHDERDLVDAKTEFHATHRGQKFHFASAEAKQKFEGDPSTYAPAAYGADVVALTRDKDVIEGSLDFAAWFKGRLYLFGTQDAHDEFVANPVQYATPAGIE